MLNLGKVGVGITVVDQFVEIVAGFPDAHFAATQRFELGPFCARWGPVADRQSKTSDPENAYRTRICMKTVFWYFFMPRALPVVPNLLELY